MITISTCICIVALALIAALFSLQHSELLLDVDREKFVPPFFKSEGFYRAFLINLSFAGISLAATRSAPPEEHIFWAFSDPMLIIVLNLIVGLLASYLLGNDASSSVDSRRRSWVIGMVLLGLLVFTFSVWTAVDLSSNANDLTSSAVTKTK